MQKIETPSNNMMGAFKMLQEGTLAELINGIIYMSPSPTAYHQMIAGNIFAEIRNFVRAHDSGRVVIAPCDVFLDDEMNAVQPDVFFISKDNPATALNAFSTYSGVPDLIIEVLSPGNPHHDWVAKKRLYERFGVKEYWVIDQLTRESTGYILRGNKYETIGAFREVIHCVTFNAEFRFWD